MHIAGFENSAYMKLLKFSASKAGDFFTKDDAISKTGVKEQQFDKYIDILYVRDKDSDRFCMSVRAAIQYVQFEQLSEAVKLSNIAQINSYEAQQSSKNAMVMSFLAIALSTIFALIQILGTVELNEDQFKKIEKINEPVVKAIEDFSKSNAEGNEKLFQKSSESIVNKLDEVKNELIEQQKRKEQEIGID